RSRSLQEPERQQFRKGAFGLVWSDVGNGRLRDPLRIFLEAFETYHLANEDIIPMGEIAELLLFQRTEFFKLTGAHQAFGVKASLIGSLGLIEMDEVLKELGFFLIEFEGFDDLIAAVLREISPALHHEHQKVTGAEARDAGEIAEGKFIILRLGV